MKYQLAIYWKDGSKSGRVIDLDWSLRKDPRTAKTVLIWKIPTGKTAK